MRAGAPRPRQSGHYRTGPRWRRGWLSPACSKTACPPPRPRPARTPQGEKHPPHHLRASTAPRPLGETAAASIPLGDGHVRWVGGRPVRVRLPRPRICDLTSASPPCGCTHAQNQGGPGPGHRSIDEAGGVGFDVVRLMVRPARRLVVLPAASPPGQRRHKNTTLAHTLLSPGQRPTAAHTLQGARRMARSKACE